MDLITGLPRSTKHNDTIMVVVYKLRKDAHFISAKLLAQGKTQGSTLQQRTKKTLTIGPFGNTCEADEVSPEVEAGVVVRLRCLQP
jgi:hypothetical protein